MSFTVNIVQRTVGESVLLVGELVWSAEGGAAVSPLSWIISIRGGMCCETLQFPHKNSVGLTPNPERLEILSLKESFFVFKEAGQ